MTICPSLVSFVFNKGDIGGYIGVMEKEMETAIQYIGVIKSSELCSRLHKELLLAGCEKRVVQCGALSRKPKTEIAYGASRQVIQLWL